MIEYPVNQSFLNTSLFSTSLFTQHHTTPHHTEMGSPRLVEVVLSSTSASSPLPLTCLHSLETGQLFFSFKSPPPPSTTTTTSTGKGKEVVIDDHDTSMIRQTMSLIKGGDGNDSVSNSLIGLGGKDGRALLNVWNFERESTISRLIPPVRLTTINTSPDGQYLVGGTFDGRVFLWELSTGQLLSTLECHYRSVNCLSFTKCSSCLITGSEDAGVSVWNLGRVLNNGSNNPHLNPPTPFTNLSDHTLGINQIVTGQLGVFPNVRIFTASKDGTVKIWDLSTTTSGSGSASLLTSFQFDGPVQHLVVDPLERFFFVTIPTTTTTTTTKTDSSTTGGGGSKVLRVNLFRESNNKENGRLVAVGGTGSIGELERISSSSHTDDEPGMSYTLS